MRRLTSSLVNEVRHHLTGARRAKFDASVQVLDDSLAQGAWVTRGSIKADSGFYQGLYAKLGDRIGKLGVDRDSAHAFDMCFRYGDANVTAAQLAAATPKLSAVEIAWVRLCWEKRQAKADLDAARPAPRVTAIGLSPKVTATITEMGLDLDLATIRMAKLDFYETPARDRDGEPVFARDGTPVMVRIYYVVWSKGIRHGLSRFAHCDCEACGKRIPSGRLVPVEATCRKNGLVSLWLGCDCAANIFGIKDDGIDPKAAPPAGGAS